MMLVVILTVMYTFLNFALFLGLTRGLTAERRGSHYYLHSHGAKVRDITAAEYHRHRALWLRGFSGHWILFSLIPFVYFRYVRRPSNANVVGETGAPSDLERGRGP